MAALRRLGCSPSCERITLDGLFSIDTSLLWAGRCVEPGVVLRRVAICACVLRLRFVSSAFCVVCVSRSCSCVLRVRCQCAMAIACIGKKAACGAMGFTRKSGGANVCMRHMGAAPEEWRAMHSSPTVAAAVHGSTVVMSTWHHTAPFTPPWPPLPVDCAPGVWRWRWMAPPTSPCPSPTGDGGERVWGDGKREQREEARHITCLPARCPACALLPRLPRWYHHHASSCATNLPCTRGRLHPKSFTLWEC